MAKVVIYVMSCYREEEEDKFMEAMLKKKGRILNFIFFYLVAMSNITSVQNLQNLFFVVSF